MRIIYVCCKDIMLLYMYMMSRKGFRKRYILSPRKILYIHTPRKIFGKIIFTNCYFYELFTCYKRVTILILQFTDNRRMCIDRILNVMWVWYFAEILTVCRNAAFINWWLRITFRKLARTGKVVSDFLQYYQFTKAHFLLISLLALSCHATQSKWLAK